MNGEKQIKEKARKDLMVWQAISENSAKKIWNNKKDDEIWSKY